MSLGLEFAGVDALRPMVSVVVPAFNEAENISLLLTAYRQFAEAHPEYTFELFVVDDGSTDGTADYVCGRASPADRVTVVQLARNFGSHCAISAGLAQCTGECAVVFGADLQEPPSLLGDFLAHWEQGSDIVWGVRRSRVGRTALHEMASKSFSTGFARYANLANYPPEGPSGVLIDRCVIDEVGRLPERNRNVLALVSWLGFKQTRVNYDQLERRNGRTGWTRAKMVKLAVDSFIQFSSMPLRLCSFSGLLVAALGMIYAAVLVIRSIVGVPTPSGWPTVIVLVLFLGGMQLIVIGIMGEYLWRAVEESRGRPLYVIKAVRSPGREDLASTLSPRRGRRPVADGVRSGETLGPSHPSEEERG